MAYNTRTRRSHVPSSSMMISSRDRSSSPEVAPTKSLKRSFAHEGNSTSRPSVRRKLNHHRLGEVEDEEADADISDHHVSSRRYAKSTFRDEVVDAVLAYIKASRNRPMTIRELTAALKKSVSLVRLSANPTSIIASRLSAYTRRSEWSETNPCPLCREQEDSRRSVYYLTTMPILGEESEEDSDEEEEEIEEDEEEVVRRSVEEHSGVPSLSALPELSYSADTTPDATDDDSLSSDDFYQAEMERRRALRSPSPEVDLSSPELDDDREEEDEAGSYVMMTPTPHIGSRPKNRYGPSSKSYTTISRSTSPPLEKDEHEFTETASGLFHRKKGGTLLNYATDTLATATFPDLHPRDDLFDELTTTRLISTLHHTSTGATTAGGASTLLYASPMGKPSASSAATLANNPSKSVTGATAKKEAVDTVDHWITMPSGALLEWDRSPEMMDPDELDCLFDC